MKYKVLTDRGEFIMDNLLNVNEARDQLEAKEKGIEIYQYVELKDAPKPQQQNGQRR